MTNYTFKTLLAIALLACATVAFADGNDRDTRRDMMRNSEAKSGLVIKPTRSDGGYRISYLTDKETVGLQFDLYSMGLSDSAFSCGDQFASEFVVDCTIHEEKGFVRVLVFSPSLEVIPSGPLMSIQATGHRSRVDALSAAPSSPRLVNVVFSDSNGKNVTPARHRVNQ